MRLCVYTPDKAVLFYTKAVSMEVDGSVVRVYENQETSQAYSLDAYRISIDPQPLTLKMEQMVSGYIRVCSANNLSLVITGDGLTVCYEGERRYFGSLWRAEVRDGVLELEPSQ